MAGAEGGIFLLGDMAEDFPNCFILGQFLSLNCHGHSTLRAVPKGGPPRCFDAIRYYLTRRPSADADGLPPSDAAGVAASPPEDGTAGADATGALPSVDCPGRTGVAEALADASPLAMLSPAAGRPSADAPGRDTVPAAPAVQHRPSRIASPSSRPIAASNPARATNSFRLARSSVPAQSNSLVNCGRPVQHRTPRRARAEPRASIPRISGASGEI